MTGKTEIKILTKDGRIEIGTILSSRTPPWFVDVAIGSDERRIEGVDLFEALKELRRQIEMDGCLMLCNGARPNVFPSRMSRDMGGGRKAYVTQPGKRAMRSDLVDIFDYAAPELVGTVEEQDRCRIEWYQSFRR